jgi:transcriptional regulator with XRE-family HTH domain
MRLTTHELAQLAGLSFRTVQNIEREVSEGTVTSVNALLGLLGLKLGVVRADDPSG